MKNLLLLPLFMLLLHCANKESVRPFGSAAPTQEQDLGFIYEASRAEVELVQNQLPKASTRHLGLNFYETSRVSQAELQAILPNASFEKNAFIHTQKSKIKAYSDQPFKMLNAADDAKNAALTCVKSPLVPSVSIQTSLNPIRLALELGEQLDVTVAAKANEKVGGTVRIIWDMVPPSLSRNKLAKGIGPSQSFIPDTPGEYVFAIIAQGKDLACVGHYVSVLVTANPQPNSQLQITNPPQPGSFSHIRQVQAESAWQRTQGENVVVAVLDTGLNYNHPSIRDNLSIKQSELDKDNLDSDNNKLADDFIGWDFVNGDNLPFDDDGHGSHVSGLVASPVTGVAPKAKILPIKVLDASGRTDIGTFVQGLLYAISSDVQVINASLGVGPVPNIPAPLKKLFDLANEKNILIVTAAGNGDENGNGRNISKVLVLPASMEAENQIVVAATAQEKITSYSDFSSRVVHVAAPGGDAKEPVYSLATINGRSMAFMPAAGTSMATPITSGLAALALSINPDLKPAQVKQLIMETGNHLESLKDKTVTGKRVNAFNLVEKLSL